MPGYDDISVRGTRVSVPGYESVSAGVREYQCQGTRVLVSGTRVFEPGYDGSRAVVQQSSLFF